MSLLAAAAALSPELTGAGKASRLGRFVVSFEWVSVAVEYRQQYRQREHAHIGSNQGQDNMRANKVRDRAASRCCKC